MLLREETYKCSEPDSSTLVFSLLSLIYVKEKSFFTEKPLSLIDWVWVDKNLFHEGTLQKYFMYTMFPLKVPGLK